MSQHSFNFGLFGRLFLAAALCLSSVGCSAFQGQAGSELVALGWIEKVYLSPGDIILHAKLDTGADSSSLNAQNIEIKKRKDSAWVSFELSNRYGEHRRLELKVYRFVKIKTKTGHFQRRPVVRLGLCLGGRFQVVDFSLVDRSHFAYPVLVGRNFLSGAILVDSSNTFQSEPVCSVVPVEDDA